jgi:transposase InsO family protein
MTWRETCPMDQRVQLIGDYLKREYSISDLSRMYLVSRKTTYKWIRRYQEGGLEALNELPRTPHSHPRVTPDAVVGQVVQTKLKNQRWGPKKVIAWLNNNHPGEGWPAPSTAGKILKREGLVKNRKIRRHVPPYTQPFSECEAANDVWSIDYKGQFRMGDGKLCYPLTISDNYSRYLLLCRGLFHPSYEATQPWLEWTFREYGLPKAIKSDNGEPFASVALGGLTKLSIWIVKLGIIPERIELGHPEQNGRHERMHRTLKEYTISPPRGNMAQQQRAFDRFRPYYDCEIPHEALDFKTPATYYARSVRPYPSRIPEIEYGSGFSVRQVRSNGQIRWNGDMLYVCEALAGEPIGLRQVNERYWEMRFSFLLLGYIDEVTGKITKTLGQKVLPMFAV